MRADFWFLLLCLVGLCDAIVVPGAGKMVRSKSCTTSTKATPTCKQHPTSVISHPKPQHSPCVNCVNSPENRQCWEKFNIDTNYYETTPDTGVTRSMIIIYKES